MVYAKTPVADSESDGGKNIMYASLWKFENGRITDNQIKIIKDFGQDNNVMQLRAGKYGDNKLFITYAPTTTKGSHRYGTVNKGTIPKVFIIELPSFKFIEKDKQYDDLFMNTNEDLRTFSDGVIIWATANSTGNLVINKIGSPRLDKSFDDIDYIITKDDLKEIENEYNEKEKGKYYEDDEEHHNEKDEGNNDEDDEDDGNHDDEGGDHDEEKNSLNSGEIFAISFGIILGVLILAFSIFILYKCLKKKNSEKEINLNNLNNEMLIKN